MIYADNAATTKMSKKAFEAMTPFLMHNFGNPSSLYSIGQQAKDALDDAREKIAKAIGAKPTEIIFTSGGSEADNQAIFSAAKQGKESGKMHIVSSAIEHHAVLHTLDKLKEQDFEITLLPVGEDGIVSVDDLKSAVREDTCLVTIMYANNEIGTIQPIREIGELCRKLGITFHTDAVQAIGHVPVNVGEDNIDMLSFSAHKFHGPKGIGALYVKTGLQVENLINGGHQEAGLRAGTENVAAIVAMAAALEEAVENMDGNMEKTQALRDRLIDGLSKIPYGELNGDRNIRLPGNVNFCFEGIDGESLLLLLDQKGICSSTGSACNTGSTAPSHVLTAIGRSNEVAHSSIRLTLSEENTEDEVDVITKSVTAAVDMLRMMSPFWMDVKSGKRQHELTE